MTKLPHRLRSTAALAALAAILGAFVVATPAWAGTVQVQDDAAVLNTTSVQNEGATLPVGVYIWTTTQDAASNSAFDTDVRTKVSSTFPIVIGINTTAKHESVQMNSRTGLSQSAAVSAASSANSAFTATMRSSANYTSAVVSALDSLRSSLAGRSSGNRASSGQSASARSSGGGFPTFVLIIGLIVIVAILVGLWRLFFGGRRQPRTMVGPPPMAGPYGPPAGQPYYPGYEPQYRSGMSPGGAGALGAIGGGLLGYELGKLEGEREGERDQFRRDEMMMDDRRNRDDSYGQGDWTVGQDGDFGGGGDQNWGNSGDGNW